jgi:glyoxylase-like metal-dependent hydrolase (beta-lactamase superfamily II)
VPGPEAPGPGADGVEPRAPGVDLVWTAAHPDYRSLVVERADHLVLVEAPLDDATATDLLALLERRYPAKPVRWLVATHHHFDHAGGVPALLGATEATLVTTPGNEGFFGRALAGPRTLRGAVAGDSVAEILAVARRHVLPGEGPEVVVLSLGPTDHVEEILGVYLPESRILFQGDFARLPLTANELYRPDAGVLRRRIQELGLEVERIAGVHGDVGTPDDLPVD